MAQVKKEAVRTSIVDAAAAVFEREGYVGASMPKIAAAAKQSVANIYNYYPSKLDLAFEVFEPWINEQLSRIETEAMRKRSPRGRLEHILRGLWCVIPQENHNFFNNFIQAIATATPSDGYRPTILHSIRERVLRTLVECLPPEQRDSFDASSFAHVAVMAFDGFVINAHLDPKSACTDQIIATMCDLILNSSDSQAKKKTSR